MFFFARSGPFQHTIPLHRRYKPAALHHLGLQTFRESRRLTFTGQASAVRTARLCTSQTSKIESRHILHMHDYIPGLSPYQSGLYVPRLSCLLISRALPPCGLRDGAQGSPDAPRLPIGPTCTPTPTCETSENQRSGCPLLQ